MELNFDVAFAENGQKSDISEYQWLQGWVEIVGGINGVPTAQQFNQFGYVFDKKANVAYAKALEAASDLTSKADKTYVDEKLEGKADSTDFDKHKSDTTAHVSAAERDFWNEKANKSDIPTSLPANGGNADTVDGLHSASFIGSGAHEYWSQNGGDANTINHDYHQFVFGMLNTPFSFCFLDVRKANAAGFAPNGQQPIIVQTAVCYNTSQAAIRQSVDNGNSWSDWTMLSDGGNSATVNGHTVNADVPANAKFTDTNTTYSAGTGIAISGTTISNSGVRSVATGGSNGTIAVNTNGTSTNVPVKGLAGAAYQAVQTAAGTVGLHRISSGTAAATATNCPAGCWYGQYE